MVVTVAINTLGCKVNQAETEKLSRQFIAAGYVLVSTGDVADVYVLNSCTVTHIADRKSHHWLRMAHRTNPEAILVVTGCYAERVPGDLKRLEGVNLVIGNADKPRLVGILNDSGLVKRTLSTDRAESIKETPFPCRPGYHPGNPGIHGCSPQLKGGEPRGGVSLPVEPGGRTRSFIKVQDGCHNFCAYCIVPYVRRNETSLPPDRVIAEVKQRQAEGYQEVVITGVEVGSYHYPAVPADQGTATENVSQAVMPDFKARPDKEPGISGMTSDLAVTDSLPGKESNGVRLKELLMLILRETSIPRLRLSSLQPPEVTPELIGLWRDPRLCRHFHLSLQSGSDTVLKRMGRRYNTADYERAVALIRSMVPGAAITTDIIVGFPGETEKEFATSYEFCGKMEFARTHVFPYSPRKGTRAAALSDQVDVKLTKQRTARFLALAAEGTSNFCGSFKGETLSVLFEKRERGFWSGLTDNYIRVFIASEAQLTNRILPVKLAELWGEGVKGRLNEI